MTNGNPRKEANEERKDAKGRESESMQDENAKTKDNINASTRIGKHE